MQAIIMAAGKGSRLGDLTHGGPKSFVEIKGKKLIEYNLDMLRKHNVSEIIIVTGYRSDAFEKLTADMPDVRIVYNPFYEMANVIGSFYMGMPYLNDDFMYLHADTICEDSIIDRMLDSKADAVLPVEYKKCDDEAMKVRSENGKIVQITKKMDCSIAEGEFIGIAFFRKKVLDDLRVSAREVLRNKDYMAYFESAIQGLIDLDKYDIETIPTKGDFWAEVDFKEDYDKATVNIPDGMTGK